MANSRPAVVLPQSKVVGIRIKDEFPQPIDAFFGIPYAQPPVGDLRFRPALRVAHSTSTTIDASKYGPIAPGKALLEAGPQLEQSEDCLTANVFRPSDIHDKALPVAIYIHGGAFNRGSSSLHDTKSMVAWSAQPFIAVSFNYRLGALGFLPSTVAKNEGILNLGLCDQVLLMQWVQENISFFGGDPNTVTLVGLSAGAHSIGHHLLSYSESNPNKPLFHRVVIESGASTSRAVRPYNAAIHEAQFRDFLNEVGAPQSLPETEIFNFLRALPTGTITSAQTAVFDKYNLSLQWAFQPVIGGDIIPRAPLEAWKKGLWHKVPTLTGFTTNEGTMYVDKKMDGPSAFRAFWANLLPALSSGDLDTIETLYPDPSIHLDSPYFETRKAHGLGSQFKRIEAAYAHYAYVAPVRQTAHFASMQIPGSVWLFH